MNYNLVLLAGNLTKDPEMSYTTEQKAVVNFNIAVNSRYGQREETCFMRCAAFGATAENITKYLTKGSPIFVEGRLVQNNWTAQDGTKRSQIQMIVNSFRFVGGGQRKETAGTQEADDDF